MPVLWMICKEIYFARREEEWYWTEISEDEKRIIGKYNQALKIMCWNIFWILTSLEGENYSCPKIIKVEEWIWFYCSCYRKPRSTEAGKL